MRPLERRRATSTLHLDSSMAHLPLIECKNACVVVNSWRGLTWRSSTCVASSLSLVVISNCPAIPSYTQLVQESNRCRRWRIGCLSVHRLPISKPCHFHPSAQSITNVFCNCFLLRLTLQSWLYKQSITYDQRISRLKYTVSQKKLCQLIFYSLSVKTDFNKNWKGWSGINP